MVTLYYILAVVGALIGFLIGWRVSPFFISKREKFAESGSQIFIKRIGMAIGCGIIPFYIFAGHAEKAEKEAKSAESANIASITMPTIVESAKKPDDTSMSPNAMTNQSVPSAAETLQTTPPPKLAGESESTQSQVNSVEQQASEQLTWSPSFDCAKASTGAERLICSNKGLSAADVNLNQAYKNALSSSADKNVLKKEQIAWRKNERDACSDVDCMTKIYEQRITQLSRQ